MTAQSPVRRNFVFAGVRREWNEDTRQFLAVIVVALIALLIAWFVRDYTVNATRSISVGGVTASIPQSWVVQQGTQDLLFTAADPRTPGQRVSVLKPSDLGTDVDTVANATVAGKSHVLPEFQVLDRGTDTVNGQDVPAVNYTYVTNRVGAVPLAIEGRDLFLPASGGVLVVTFESPARGFAAALDTFERFAASVRG